jgi:hypothetical protein
MSKWSMLWCALILVAGAAAASGDLLALANGGELKGALQEVTFLTGGKQRTVSAGQVAFLHLSDGAQDLLRLADNTELQGELISIKFRSIGGALTFSRKDVAGISFGADKISKAKKDLAKRAAVVDKTDPTALIELAEWCSEKKLNTEAREYARAALKLDPAGAAGTRAKKLLGSAKPPPADEPEPDPAAKPKPDPELTPEQLAALRRVAEQNESLYKKYVGRIDELRKEELDEAKAVFKNWDRVKSRLKKLASEAKRLRSDAEEKIEEYRKKARNYEGGSSHVTRYRQSLMRNVERVEDQYKRAKREALQYLEAVKRATSYVGKRAMKRRAGIRLVRNKCQRLLLVGQSVDAAKLEAAYENALKLGEMKLKDVEVDWENFDMPKLDSVRPLVN